MTNYGLLLLATAASTLAIPITAQQLVADLVTTGIPASSSPRFFTDLGSKAVFVATTGEGGSEPWVTDGTAAGTLRLRDLQLGLQDSDPRILATFQGRAVFSAADGFYVTDGTPAGTVPVANLGIGTISTFLGLANGTLLVTDSTGNVFATDLTAAGTTAIPGMRNFGGSGNEVAGLTYGICSDPVAGNTLWATDGTPTGSRLITALPGTAQHFTGWNNRIYFLERYLASYFLSSTDGVAGYTRHVQLVGYTTSSVVSQMFPRGNQLIWVRSGTLQASDLTVAGTGPVTLPCTDLGPLVEFNGDLYMRANSPATGLELWTTDGTAAGTAVVADLVPGPAGSNPDHLIATSTGLYYRSIVGDARSFMRCLNTTTIVNLGPLPTNAPVDPTVSSLTGSAFVPFLGGFLFAAGGPAGVEPWFASTTQIAAQIADINDQAPGLQTLQTSVANRDQLAVLTLDLVHGVEFCITDGTATNTRIVDLVPGPVSGLLPFRDSLARVGDRIAYLRDVEVALTDGTTATRIVSAGGGLLLPPLRVVDDRIYFRKDWEVHFHDLATSTTRRLPGTPSLVTDFHVLPAGFVSFGIGTSVGDGIAPSVQISTNSLLYGRLGDTVFFRGSSSSSNLYELGATDGSIIGTRSLATFTAPITHFTVGGTAAWFLNDGALWRTDGTPSGTQLMTAVPAGLLVTQLIARETGMLGVCSDTTSGSELWRYDPPTAQLVRVTDLVPGPLSGVQYASALGDGDLVLLAGGDETTGCEPYVSDGTATGTVQLADINPGAGSSNPSLVGVADGVLYITADDGVHGTEIWKLPLATAGVAAAQGFGVACSGAGGLPRLRTTTPPILGSASFGFELDRVRSLAPTLLGLGFVYGSTNLGGCELLLSGSAITMGRMSSLGGTASFGVPLPASSQLIGFRLVTQAFALDPTTARGFVASDGQIIVVGR